MPSMPCRMHRNGGEKERQTMDNKKFFTMKQSGTFAEIEIFDEIGFLGIGPKEFKASLDKLKDSKTIKLLLNSPGGNLFDGMTIYNLLVPYRSKLDIEIVGLAASIASIIALAGRSLTMAEGSYFMIHNPFTALVGNAEDLRKTAVLLDKMAAEFVGIYKANSGLTEAKIKAFMDQEKWFTASEAVDAGFASGVQDYGQIAAKTARFDLRAFKHAPTMTPGQEIRKMANAAKTQLMDVGIEEALESMPPVWRIQQMEHNSKR